MKSFVVLISGRGSNLQAIIDAIASGKITGSIAAVISNRADAAGLTVAARAGIPCRVIEAAAEQTREQYDAELMQQIDALKVDFVVLAGFMRILSAGFIAHYANRILNIHPSLLPAFKGMHTHRRALAAGSTRHGASVHFVSAELDSGAVVLQAEVAVKPDDTEKTLAKRVLQAEHVIYPMVIQWYIEGRLGFSGAQLYFDNKPLNAACQWKNQQLLTPDN
ncbi:MAG: phosphoribosylglycinamide formyltransferase [Gammaproteobacteria bacterium]